MLEGIVLLGGFAFSAALGYLAISFLFRTVSPGSSPVRKYRIAADDVIFLHQIRNFFDPKECVLFTGDETEILAEMENTNVDFAAIERRGAARCMESSMNHIRASYLPIEPAAIEYGLHVFMLTNRARDVDIYYRDSMRPVVLDMLRSSAITKIN